MMRTGKLAVATLLTGLLGLGGAAAQSVPDDVVSASLLTGWQTSAGTRMAGLSLDLAPDWKTYWRAPGEAGIPPRFDWSRSENVAAVEVHFPRPTLFLQSGLRSFGYKHDVVWPVEITPAEPGRPVTLRGDIALGVCREVCIPKRLHLAATLPSPGRDAETAAIRAALARQPVPAAEAGIGEVSCRLEPIAGGLRLTARMEIPRLGADEAVVVEPVDATLFASPAQVSRTGDTLKATTDLLVPEDGTLALDRSGLKLTVLGGNNAVAIEGCPAPAG